MSELYELLAQKFSSANDVAVERVTITRAEYEAAIIASSKMRLVPVNPTYEMLFRGTEGDIGLFGDHARFVWSEMLSVLPKLTK